MSLIRNKNQLIERGQTKTIRKARELALGSLEAALTAVNPQKLVESQVFIHNSTLCAGEYKFNLKDFEHVFVIGGGKASGSMALAIEKVLGSRITEGIINVPKGDKHKTRIVCTIEAGHPLPNKASIEGAQKMLGIAENAAQDDLVIVLISGGGSSLMAIPREEIKLEEKQVLTNSLLKSGATIKEINTVRKHISNFKGGWLAKKVHPAKVLNLILSDVIGDPLEAIASGPTVPDPTTFTDARRVLEKYGSWTEAPISIKKLFSAGERGVTAETPKPDDPVFRKVRSLILGNCWTAASASYNYLKKTGLNTLLLTTPLDGEARNTGEMLGAIVDKIITASQLLLKPAALVATGETTVTVTGKGLGGRNQELVMGAAPKLSNIEGAVIASFSTDGIDGPTNVAGAIADSRTITQAVKLGLEPQKMLEQNDSNRFFSKLNDTIITGPTGTNVNDISVIVFL